MMHSLINQSINQSTKSAFIQRKPPSECLLDVKWNHEYFLGVHCPRSFLLLLASCLPTSSESSAWLYILHWLYISLWAVLVSGSYTEQCPRYSAVAFNYKFATVIAKAVRRIDTTSSSRKCPRRTESFQVQAH